ncbi:MAG: hypothetical protein NT027_19860 [Proteobacteria bacterium]|nr:hypothetical protein [Pseudomonadota bacterium]
MPVESSQTFRRLIYDVVAILIHDYFQFVAMLESVVGLFLLQVQDDFEVAEIFSNLVESAVTTSFLASQDS